MLVLGALVLLGSSTAAAVEAGTICTLNAPLAIKLKGKSGTVEATVDSGTEVQVVAVGEAGGAFIRTGDMRGTVLTEDLDAACKAGPSAATEFCSAIAPMTMYEKNRSDSRSKTVQVGVEVGILKRGKTWAAVRAGDATGFVKTSELITGCSSKSAPADDEEPPETSPLEREEGPGILLLPFQVEGNAPPGHADVLLEHLAMRLALYRPDSGRLDAPEVRQLTWQEQITRGVKQARNAETAYVLLGRISVDKSAGTQAPNEPARYQIQLAMVDATSEKSVKGIKVKATIHPGDKWAELALSSLLPAVPAAPGSKLPPTPGAGAR